MIHQQATSIGPEGNRALINSLPSSNIHTLILQSTLHGPSHDRLLIVIDTFLDCETVVELADRLPSSQMKHLNICCASMLSVVLVEVVIVAVLLWLLSGLPY